MASSFTAQPTVKRDWWINGGMAVTATAAAVSSFAGLRELAIATGWPTVLAALLPLTVDAYAMTATRVWLTQGTGSRAARRFARWNAIAAIALSIAGNATWHLIAANVVTVNWKIIVVVGAVPPAVLGLLSHLAVLRTHVDAVPGTTPASTRSDDELLTAARAADGTHRKRHGRPISRDRLREALRISGTRATELLHQLKAERITAEKRVGD